MNKEFEKRLKALVKEFGYDLLDHCIYCGRANEIAGTDSCLMVTFCVPEKKEGKQA